MASRRKLESTVFVGAPSDEPKTTIYVNKDVLVSFAQHGSPSKLFPLYLLIAKNENIEEFELPDVIPPLPIAEEVSQYPNLLDIGRWLDSIDCAHDAMFAAQIGSIILNRLPESYKAKLAEGP